jgi:hypothetical protein
VPFVQGQLRAEPLSFQIATECAHCGQALHLEVDRELNYRVVEEGPEPLVFVPAVDFEKLQEPSIIDAF